MVNETEPIGITAYARHRRCSPAAVHKAIRSGRLRGAVVKVHGRVMLRSAAAADREWEARTDRTRRPDYARDTSSAAPANEPTLSPSADDDADLLDTAPAADPMLADYQREAMRERARKLKMENDLRAGQLLEAAHAAAAAFEFSRVLRENVLNVPGRVSAEIAAESDAGRVHALLDAALREALDATADVMERPSGDVSTAQKESVQHAD